MTPQHFTNITRVSFIQYARKIFRKTNISYPLVRRRTREYQRVRNVSFSKDFGYVLNNTQQQNVILPYASTVCLHLVQLMPFFIHMFTNTGVRKFRFTYSVQLNAPSENTV